MFFFVMGTVHMHNSPDQSLFGVCPVFAHRVVGGICFPLQSCCNQSHTMPVTFPRFVLALCNIEQTP